MTKCQFCHFENEDGAAFCEQCKSDLSAPIPEPAPAIAEPAPVVLEAIPLADVEAGGLPVAAEVVAVSAESHPVPIPVPVPAIKAEPPVPTPEPQLELPPKVSSPSTPPPPSAAAPEHAVSPSAPPVASAGTPLPPNAQPRLLVLRGQKRNVEYPLYDGLNFVGRADDKPVDIDLEDQEPPDRVWCSRQHCCISFEGGKLDIEDLNSANGTYVNRQRIYPGQKQELHVSDIIQIGNVQLRVIV
jgi:hypothetical protein